MKNQSQKEALDFISAALDKDIERLSAGEKLSEIKNLPPFRQENVYNRLLEQIDRPRNKRKFLWLKIAAVIIPFLVLNTGLWLFHGDFTAPALKEIYVPRGEKMTVLMSDGTKIWLNADTRLLYPERFTGKQRKVVLEGEAYFQVHKNKKMPFVVEASSMQIQVLGTAFNVKAYTDEENITTTLDEGSIRIGSNSGNRFDYFMKPGETAVYSRENGTCLINRNEHYKNESGWKHDELIFTNDSLQEILASLERRYDVSFEIPNPEIYAFTYTFTSKNETLKEILATMENITPIRCKQTDKNKITINVR